MKRVLFDVGHPAQVHQFKYIYRELEAIGYKCLFVAKDKDVTIRLLKEYNLEYVLLSLTKSGLINKILSIPNDDFKFYKIVKDFRPDFILNRFSIHSGHVSKLFGIPNFGFSDTEHASKLHKLTLPFIDVKFTGKSYYLDLGNNQIRYDSNIELFYLHPKVFVKHIDSWNRLGLRKGEKYCLIRFVSWEAHHDVGVKTMSLKDKRNLVSYISKKYRVFISSEGEAPPEFKDYIIRINPIEMHAILQDAELYIGEGGTMASEAACLNTPVIYTNPLPLMGYLKEQQQYGLLNHIIDVDQIIDFIDSNNHIASSRYDEYIKKKINPTELIVWFITNYPESKRIMKETPDYQYNFR